MTVLTKAAVYALLLQHGVDGELAHCMAAGAYAESRWDTHAVGDNGHSVGLYQLHDQGLGRGLGQRRYDPDVQVTTMKPEYQREYQRWQRDGYEGVALCVMVCAYAEKPYQYDRPYSAARRGYQDAYYHARPDPPEEEPMPEPGTHYDPDTSPERQTLDWTCSVNTIAWCLRSLGFDVSPIALRHAMVAAGLVTPQDGLLDGSGIPLQNWLADTYRVVVHQWQPADWDYIHAVAGACPIAIGGAAWNHWAAVRAAAGDGLELMNPAVGHMGIQHRLERADWQRLGPWAALWLPVQQQEEDDVSVLAELQRVAREEVLPNIEKALATPRLPKAAREALEFGAKPAAETIARGGEPA